MRLEELVVGKQYYSSRCKKKLWYCGTSLEGTPVVELPMGEKVAGVEGLISIPITWVSKGNNRYWTMNSDDVNALEEIEEANPPKEEPLPTEEELLEYANKHFIPGTRFISSCDENVERKCIYWENRKSFDWKVRTFKESTRRYVYCFNAMGTDEGKFCSNPSIYEDGKGWDKITYDASETKSEKDSEIIKQWPEEGFVKSTNSRILDYLSKSRCMYSNDYPIKSITGYGWERYNYWAVTTRSSKPIVEESVLLQYLDLIKFECASGEKKEIGPEKVIVPLIAEAKRKYPVGTQFKSATSGLIKAVSDSDSFFMADDDKIYLRTPSGKANGCLYFRGRWAEITGIDLIAEAKKRYPVGTKVRSTVSSKEAFIKDTDEFVLVGSTTVYIKNRRSVTTCVHSANGKWADIIGGEVPKTYTEDLFHLEKIALLTKEGQSKVSGEVPLSESLTGSNLWNNPCKGVLSWGLIPDYPDLSHTQSHKVVSTNPYLLPIKVDEEGPCIDQLLCEVLSDAVAKRAKLSEYLLPIKID